MAAEATKIKQYVYTSIDAAGERVSGKMNAENEADVYEALHRSNMVPLEVRSADKFALDSDLGALIGLGSEPKLNTSGLAQLTRQLHQLLKAGISVTQAVQSLADDPPTPAVGEALTTVAERLTSGESLAEAFSGFPKLFSEVFVAYMAAGEQSGDLVAVTERLSAILDKRAEIQRKVKAVSMYPMLVMVAIGVMVSGIILFIVPKFAQIYDDLDAELPAPTQMVVMLSKYFPAVVAVIGLSVFAAVMWNKSKKSDLEVGTKIDKARFKMPIFGAMFKKLVLFRFTSTMGGAIASGVSTFDAVQLAADASDSRWVRATAPDLQRCIQEGRPLSQGMRENDDLYPPNIRKLVSTGEETGDTATMFSNAAAFLEDEIDLTISTMSAKIEVALLMVMGVVVGSVLAALYLPILGLSSAASEKYN